MNVTLPTRRQAPTERWGIDASRTQHPIMTCDGMIAPGKLLGTTLGGMPFSGDVPARICRNSASVSKQASPTSARSANTRAAIAVSHELMEMNAALAFFRSTAPSSAASHRTRRLRV